MQLDLFCPGLQSFTPHPITLRGQLWAGLVGVGQVGLWCAFVTGHSARGDQGRRAIRCWSTDPHFSPELLWGLVKTTVGGPLLVLTGSPSLWLLLRNHCKFLVCMGWMPGALGRVKSGDPLSESLRGEGFQVAQSHTDKMQIPHSRQGTSGWVGLLSDGSGVPMGFGRFVSSGPCRLFGELGSEPRPPAG